MRLLGSDADAASGAIQDAWAAAALRLRDFGSLEHLTRWVHYVSRCRAISALRKRHGTVTTPWMRRFKDDSPVPQVTDPERDPDLDAALERTIQGLPPNQRNVASLHYLYGQTVAEVARLVDLPVSTVKMRLHRARIEVRRSLCAH